MNSFLRTYSDPSTSLQARADAAVVIPTVLRPSLIPALRSIFAQRFDGRIQILVGIDYCSGDLSIIDEACRNRPSNCIVQVLYPGYSTSVRHGGLTPARDGGVLRCILTYLANTPYVAYLDDDNWWDPRHLDLLRRAIEGQDWAFSLRWFTHPEARRPICIDSWESVGPGQGIFTEKFGGFVDPNCLMISKPACPEAIPWWNYPLPDDRKGMTADRNVFRALQAHNRFACTGEPTVFYCMDPKDVLHPIRVRRMNGLYEQIGREQATEPASAAPEEEIATPHSVAAKLMRAIHGGDIYAGFDDLLPEDLQGWNSINPVFPAIVEAIRPAVVIEVGVWKGRSALYLAELLAQHNIDGAVIAIDTFLGSPEHWDRAGVFAQGFETQHGFPLLYRQFLSNVLHHGHAGRVIPLPQSSENAAVILRRVGVFADLIHIDAAHEYGPVRRDVETYWQLLRPGGYLVGDDYTAVWPEVVRAVDDFAASVKLPLGLSPPKWFLQKPPPGATGAA